MKDLLIAGEQEHGLTVYGAYELSNDAEDYQSFFKKFMGEECWEKTKTKYGNDIDQWPQRSAWKEYFKQDLEQYQNQGSK